MFLHKCLTTKNIILLFVFILTVNISVKAQKEIPENIKGILQEGIQSIDAAKVPDDIDKAVGLFKQAVKAAPEFPEVHYYLGRTLVLLEGNARNAMKEYKKYITLYPDAPDKETVTAEIARLERILKTNNQTSLIGVELMAMNGGIYIRKVKEMALGRIQSRMQRLSAGQKVLQINGEDVKESNLQDVLNKIDNTSTEKIQITVMGTGEPYSVDVPKAGNKGMMKALDEEDLSELIASNAKVLVVWGPAKPGTALGYYTKLEYFLMAHKDVKAYEINLNKNKMLDVEYGIDTETLPSFSLYKNGKLTEVIKGFEPEVFDEKIKVLAE